MRPHKAAKAVRYAFTALVNPESDGVPFILGRCDEGEPGYSRVEGVGFTSYEMASAFVQRRNEDLGLSPKDAALIVLGTMVREPARRRA
jgi:hypothetical protein